MGSLLENARVARQAGALGGFSLIRAPPAAQGMPIACRHLSTQHNTKRKRLASPIVKQFSMAAHYAEFANLRVKKQQ
ncbi:hypothetical protein [Xanthomonas graminis]|uniref:hypothetical protein n=1 Tax=Xanthomonas graminis TaxID=3390026 RepID=UPI0012DAACD9|nr:hypothetical protein [Xanthomonas translucens]